jgi:hypothetical protein
MRSRGLLLTAILTFAVSAVWTMRLSRSGWSCPRPCTASVTMLFDPCEAYAQRERGDVAGPALDVDDLAHQMPPSMTMRRL